MGKVREPNTLGLYGLDLAKHGRDPAPPGVVWKEEDDPPDDLPGFVILLLLVAGWVSGIFSRLKPRGRGHAAS